MAIETLTDEELLRKVEDQLDRYEHPLFEWRAVIAKRGIEVTVRLRNQESYDSPYRFYLMPREIQQKAFEWDFQRQLYNYLHDYLVEMFTRSPHIRDS